MAYNSFGTLWSASSNTTAGTQAGTTVAQQGSITSFANTTPFWVWQNIGNAGSVTPAIWPRALRLLLTGTAPAGTLHLNLAVIVDTVAPAITNPGLVSQNYNQDGRDSSAKSVSQITGYLAASALSVTAPSSASRTVCRARLATGVAVNGDAYTFQFGLQDQAMGNGHAGAAARATDPAHLAVQALGFSIAPTEVAYVYLWWVTSAANLPTWEWVFEWYEL